MKLSEETKAAIFKEFEDFQKSVASNKEGQYGDGKNRDALGQFYTPPELTIRMIEKFDSLDDDILDPTAGSGNLLAACIVAGADPKRIYANELDADICEKILRPRLNGLGVPDENIHVGDALNEDCLKIWSKDYLYKDGKVTVCGKRPMWFGNNLVGIDKSKVKMLR